MKLSIEDLGINTNDEAIDLIDRLLQDSSAGDPVIEAVVAHARRHPNREILSVCFLKKGEILIEEGEPASQVALLVDGSLEILKKSSPPDGQLRRLARLTTSAITGEIGTLTGTTTATVRAETDTTLVSLDALEFGKIIRENKTTWYQYRDLVSKRLATHVLEGVGVMPQIAKALLTVKSLGGDRYKGAIFKRMAEESLLSHPDIFHWRRVEAGEHIVLEGERIDFVGIIVVGQAQVIKGNGFKIDIQPGSLLGELTALTGEAATATVRAGDGPVQLLCLSRADFQKTILADVETRAKARQLCLHRLSEQLGGEKLCHETEERLREVRDNNTDALIRRAGISLISGDGLFAIMNPTSIHFEKGGVLVELVDQKYSLLASAEVLLRSSWSVDDILKTGREIRDKVDGQGYETEADAVRDAIARLTAYVERTEARSRQASISIGQRAGAKAFNQNSEVLRTRIQRVRWLNALLRRDSEDSNIDTEKLETREFQDHVQDIITAPNPHAVLDEEFGRVMEKGVRRASQAVFSDLKTIMFNKVPLGVKRFRKELRRGSSLRFSENARAINDLRQRLGRGEASAIGGSSYPRQRFSKAVLDAVANGSTHVLVFDGEAEEAFSYARCEYGCDHATKSFWPCLTSEIQGLDGSGARTLLTIKQSRGKILQVLIIAGFGKARQLHNAGAIVLYKSDDGKRIPIDKLELAEQGIDYVDLMRRELTDALEEHQKDIEGTEQLGQVINGVDQLQTQLLILQNPQELEEAFGSDRITVQSFKKTILAVSVGILRIGDSLVRLVCPKVGGHGLYGDTAGHFVTAFFTVGIKFAMPNVIFNGTAGGFGGTKGAAGFESLRGLGDIKPGGIIVPMETIEQIDDGVGPRPIRTLFNREKCPPEEALTKILDRAGITEKVRVNFVSRHGAVAAPAVETFEYIAEKLVSTGNGSVDVEGGRIWKAVTELDRDDLTFTPVYTHSDDPRSCKDNPSDSLAAMGPWFEGVELDREKYQLIEALLFTSLDLYRVLV